MLKSRARNALCLATLAGALLSLVPATARADAVPPPPTNCPDGTTGNTCHGAQWCQPATCKTSADCTAGQVCQPRSFCLGQVTCGGGVTTLDGGPVVTPEPAAGAACSTAADCDGGATCATENVCASPSSAVIQGCSCEAAGQGGGPLALSLLALVAGGAGAVARWKRRPQRASAQRRA